jgi:hypothetical protein
LSLLRLRNSCEKQGRERQRRRNAVNWNQDSHASPPGRVFSLMTATDSKYTPVGVRMQSVFCVFCWGSHNRRSAAHINTRTCPREPPSAMGLPVTTAVTVWRACIE